MVWGLILFAANLVMLFVALWALGRAARKTRQVERRIVARMDDVTPTAPVRRQQPAATPTTN